MAKRIVTKIGYIFCVEIEGQHKRYFQYIANDLSQLNSSVIRVFKRKYPMDYVFNADEVIDDEIDFYAHAILRIGILENTWYKVGKHSNVGSLEHIIFRCSNHFFNPYDMSPENWKVYDWYVWHINEDYIDVGELTEDVKQQTHYGVVFSYLSIYDRLKYGEFKIKMPY